VKQPDGRLKLNQLFSPTASGAASGTFWGALIGMIFLMPLAGAALGATSGALGGALADVGINDRFMRDAAQGLQAGNAALFLLIRKMTTDKVLAALQGESGTVTRRSFDESKQEALRAAPASGHYSIARGACRLNYPGASPRCPFPGDPHPTMTIPVPAPPGPAPPMGSCRGRRANLMTRWRHWRTHRRDGLGECPADRISQSCDYSG
jgi:uncharacterized membrane protein